MKFVNIHHKPISMFVIIAFTIMLCFWANQTPAAPTNSAPEKSSTAALENSKGEDTGFIEQDAPTHAIKKGKKFPWLIVALVVVAGGAAVYFLVLKKKKYTLTVTVGEGVSGSPAAGTSTNEKGTVVNYNYSLQSGYSDLSVTLDGAPVAASGSVTMNANHTLEAKATKTFVLTVSKGAHVNGTPNNGTYTYARGTNVPYNFAPQSGYANLEVKVDSVSVANSGTIAMDANHTLTANLHGANLVVNSTPAGARIYMDNTDTGFTTPHSFFFTTAVINKNVHVRAATCGYQEYHQTVSVNVGQTVTVNPTLAIGIREDFGIPASTCWSPYYTTGWSIFAGSYRYTGAPSGGSPNVFLHSFSGDYTVSSEMNRKKGGTGANAIFLGTSSSKTSAYGYFFAYYRTGLYQIFRFHPFNFVSWTGTYTLIKSSTSSAIQAGLDRWNTLKIVKVGSNYTFYINNTNLHSFTDSTYNPTYLSLVFHGGGLTTETRTDYVYLIPSS
ncbi:MAG TPA: PEGA domain-containing protein [Patescibacteria group bacterium]|nr:PEGA domain-containing protein [Patescibacteria group bacterium]